MDGEQALDVVALAFHSAVRRVQSSVEIATVEAVQMRAIPKSALVARVRVLTGGEVAELELATDEPLGREAPPEDGGQRVLLVQSQLRRLPKVGRHWSL